MKNGVEYLTYGRAGQGKWVWACQAGARDGISCHLQSVRESGSTAGIGSGSGVGVGSGVNVVGSKALKMTVIN